MLVFARNTLNIIYSAFIGIIAYLYVPKFYVYLWQSAGLRNTGPLIILILALAAGLYFVATLPNYYISKYLKAGKFRESGNVSIVCGIIAGAPLTIMSLINWMGAGIGGSFTGMMMVFAGGPVLGYLVKYHITLGTSDGYYLNADKEKNKIQKTDQVNTGDPVKKDPLVEMRRKIEMISLSQTKDKDITELIQLTENPEELKVIMKSSLYGAGVKEKVQDKLRKIEGYSSDEYYCDKCNKTVSSGKRNFRTSDTGRSYYDIKCIECGHKLGDGMDYID